MEQSDIVIFRDTLDLEEVQRIAEETFGEMAKAVIDIERQIVAVGGELHADAEALLLEDGSKQADLWGINLFPKDSGTVHIEFLSLINIRPAAGNRTQEIADKGIRDRITHIVTEMAEKGLS